MRTHRCRHADPEPVAIHSGVLFKRGYGKTLLIGRKSWKPRHFVLTKSTLRYSNFENGKLRDVIDLSTCTEACLEIMPANARKTGRSASSIWRLALNVPRGRRLLVAAPTEREMNAWIFHLSQTLRSIQAMAMIRPQELAENQHQQPTPELVKDQQHHQQQPTEVLVGNQRMEKQDQVVDTEKFRHHDDGLDRELAASWKSTTTDFANFVSQPRRSMIFRRYSFESQPLVPGVYRRHSTGGQVGGDDDVELPRELEELRRQGGGEEEVKSDEEEEEEEEEQLLCALRAFSVGRSGAKELGLEEEEETKEGDQEEEEEEGDDQEEEQFVSLPLAAKLPLYQYKQSEQMDEPVAAKRCVVNIQAKTKWYDRLKGKSKRDEVEQENNPIVEQDDLLSAKPRRYSTGCMMLSHERTVVVDMLEQEKSAQDGEDLIQQLLCDLVETVVGDDKGVDDNRALSVAVPSSTSGSDTTTGSSAAPSVQRSSLSESDELSVNGGALVASGGHGKQANWFKRLKTKWRVSRNDDKKRRVASSSPSLEPHDMTDADTITGEVLAVLNDLVRQVAADETLVVLRSSMKGPPAETSSESSTTPTQPASAFPARVAMDTDCMVSALEVEPCQQTHINLFRRLRGKLRGHRDTRSRRYSTGDMIPPATQADSQDTSHAGSDASIDPKTPAAASTLEDQPVAPRGRAATMGHSPREETEELRFGAKMRRHGAQSTKGLVELQQLGDFDAVTMSKAREDQQEEVVVVVVRRRRRSMASADEMDQLEASGRRVKTKFRVYVDMGDSGSEDEETFSSTVMPISATEIAKYRHESSASMKPHSHDQTAGMPLHPLRSSRICAA